MRTESSSGASAAEKDKAATVKRSFKLRGANARSKVTNGVKLLPGYDGRTIWGRRFHDLCALHARDAGGIDALSEAQVSLIRRSAALEVTLENLELDMACGREVDLDQYSRCAGHLRRILESVGIKRVARDVAPSLAQIVAAHQAKTAAEPVRASKASDATPLTADVESHAQPNSPLHDDALIEEGPPQ